MTDDPTLNSLRAALDSYVDPYLGESLGAAHAVQALAATTGTGGASVQIRLGFPVGGYHDVLAATTHGRLAQTTLCTRRNRDYNGAGGQLR